MIKQLKNKENFIKVMIDTQGYSKQQAIETADEYSNNLIAWIEARGGEKNEIAECVEFLS